MSLVIAREGSCEFSGIQIHFCVLYLSKFGLKVCSLRLISAFISLCCFSVEAFGRSAERPGLHKQDAVVSAGAEGAAG